MRLVFLQACLLLSASRALAQANPTIAYVGAKSAINVSNSDGSSATKLSLTGTRPSLAPGGSGTTADPWRLVYEPSTCHISTANLVLVKGTPTAQNITILPTPLAGQACESEWSPSGSSIVYAEGFTNLRPSSIWTILPNGNNETDLYDGQPGNVVVWPTWKSDGSKIAFVEMGENPPYDCSIKVMDSDGLNVTTVLPPDQLYYIQGLEWARTKDMLIFSSEDSKGNDYIYTLDISVPGAVPQKVAQGKSPSFSPDDSSFIYATSSIFSFDLATGKTKTLIRNADSPYRKR